MVLPPAVRARIDAIYERMTRPPATLKMNFLSLVEWMGDRAAARGEDPAEYYNLVDKLDPQDEEYDEMKARMATWLGTSVTAEEAREEEERLEAERLMGRKDVGERQREIMGELMRDPWGLVNALDDVRYAEVRPLIEETLRIAGIDPGEVVNYPRDPMTNKRMVPVRKLGGRDIPREMLLFRSPTALYQCQVTAGGKWSCRSVTPDKVFARVTTAAAERVQAAIRGREEIVTLPSVGEVKRVVCPVCPRSYEIDKKLLALGRGIAARLQFRMPDEFWMACDDCRKQRYGWTLAEWVQQYGSIVKK